MSDVTISVETRDDGDALLYALDYYEKATEDSGGNLYMRLSDIVDANAGPYRFELDEEDAALLRRALRRYREDGQERDDETEAIDTALNQL